MKFKIGDNVVLSNKFNMDELPAKYKHLDFKNRPKKIINVSPKRTFPYEVQYIGRDFPFKAIELEKYKCRYMMDWQINIISI